MTLAIPPVPSIGAIAKKKLSSELDGGKDSSRSTDYQGKSLARRRFQRGQLLLLGCKEKRWFGRWYEDVVESGQVRRIRRQEFLGTLKDYPTKKLAARELDARLGTINSPAYRARPTSTFTQFADRWEATVVLHLKPSTAINYRSHLRRHLKPFFGNYELKDMTTEMSQAFVSKLKVNPTTVRHVFVTFQSLWRSARTWGYVTQDITKGVRLPGRVMSERRYFSLEELARIIVATPEPYRTCFWFAAETGMRAGELCGLRWQDIDFSQRTVSVTQTAWWGHIQTPKTKGSVRRFSVSVELLNHLQAQLRVWTPNPLGLIFATRNGTAWSCRKPLRKLQAVLKELGIAAAGLHAFRHSQVTIAERAGVPLKTVQGRVGHGSTETTLLYSHAVGEDDRKFSAWLGSQLRPKPEVLDANGRKLFIVRPDVIEKLG
jgi:integrase